MKETVHPAIGTCFPHMDVTIIISCENWLQQCWPKGEDAIDPLRHDFGENWKAGQ